MQVKKAYRFRLEPTKRQEELFLMYAGNYRYVWNYFLAQRFQYYEAVKSTVSLREQDAQLKYLKKLKPCLAKAPSKPYQDVLKDLDRSYRSWVKALVGKKNKQGNDKETGRPQFKKKGLYSTFRFSQGCKVDGSFLTIPEVSGAKDDKVGKVKFRKSRDIEGKIKNVTIRKQGNYWFVSIQTESEINLPRGEGEVGLDLGVERFATLSNGKVFEPIDFSKLERKYEQTQRVLSNQKRGSNRWKKSKQKLNKIGQKISNKRNDFLHKVSTEISKNHAIVHVEKLKINKMTKSGKGTVEVPGKNVAVKAHLNKSILEQGWSQFLNFLNYKLEWRGGKMNPVNPCYTSQCCSKCGHIDKSNRKSQSEFKCLSCGFEENADLNASINILNIGRSGRPHLHVDSQSPSKREPSFV